MLVRLYSRWAERRGSLGRSRRDDRGPRSRAPLGHVDHQGSVSPTAGSRPNVAFTDSFASVPSTRRLVDRASFASIDVTPFLDDDHLEVDIDEKDLRVDTYSLVRRRWPARQQDGLGDPHHAPAHRHCCELPEREVPAPEPGSGAADSGGQAAPSGARASVRRRWMLRGWRG
jgi:hypothetical protein